MGLEEFIHRHHRITVLTGAGCSTDSGIPDYRDLEGQWKRSPPMTYQVFTAGELARQRYWARSMLGWPLIAAAKPNAAHLALAALERLGKMTVLITQNVDGLHQQAGSRAVIDLHGRLDRVICLQCRTLSDRADLQHRMIALNPAWLERAADIAPDGDVDLDGMDFSGFRLAPCEVCGGILKPDVVYYGESVPRDRPEAGMAALEASDGLLVVGSSLMVFSGFRFARKARDLGLPIASVNLGLSRADDFLSLRIRQKAADALAFLLDPRSETAGANLPAERPTPEAPIHDASATSHTAAATS
jgi:NAD-dependent SIR2 family protein deacetylase